MNTDQFGALGKSKERSLLELVARPGTKAHLLALNLVRQLAADIKTVDEAIAFCIAVKYVVAPTNRALVVETFTRLLENLSKLNIPHMNRIISTKTLKLTSGLSVATAGLSA